MRPRALHQGRNGSSIPAFVRMSGNEPGRSSMACRSRGTGSTFFGCYAAMPGGWLATSRTTLHPASRKYHAISACRRNALAGCLKLSIVEDETSQCGTTHTSVRLPAADPDLTGERFRATKEDRTGEFPSVRPVVVLELFGGVKSSWPSGRQHRCRVVLRVIRRQAERSMKQMGRSDWRFFPDS